MINPGTDVAGKFRIVRLIGEGAMGSVYEAEHTRLGRRVALKILHERFASSARAVGRFEREARAAAAIGHDNIVDVIDFGHHEGVPYIVMEYLRGQTLAERLATEVTIESREACRITAQVLSALASAHAIGIVHRDLKPANLMLVERAGGRVSVKILDFGISKFAPTDGANRHATQAGALMGTPGYMAPEQWMARLDVDHRADLYAVGVMFYEMLTGGLPYEGATQRELLAEVVHSTEPPPVPSDIAPGTPDALDAIALHAVRRGVSERFQSATEFVDALRAHGAGDIVVASDPPQSSDGDERIRSSPPPKRGEYITHRDGAATPEKGRNSARVYAGVSLLLAGVAIVSGAAWGSARRHDLAPENMPVAPHAAATTVVPPALVREPQGTPPRAPIASAPTTTPAMTGVHDESPARVVAPVIQHTARPTRSVHPTRSASTAGRSRSQPPVVQRRAGLTHMEVSDEF